MFLKTDAGEACIWNGLPLNAPGPGPWLEFISWPSLLPTPLKKEDCLYRK